MYAGAQTHRFFFSPVLWLFIVLVFTLWCRSSVSDILHLLFIHPLFFLNICFKNTHVSALWSFLHMLPLRKWVPGCDHPRTCSTCYTSFMSIPQQWSLLPQSGWGVEWEGVIIPSSALGTWPQDEQMINSKSRNRELCLFGFWGRGAYGKVQIKGSVVCKGQVQSMIG